MTDWATGGRIDPPHLDAGEIPPWPRAGCGYMVPARSTRRHSALLAAVNSREPAERGEQP